MGRRTLIRCSLGLAGVLASLSVAAPAPEFARLMNRGKAHLENRNSAKALEAFTAALKLKTNSAPALRNLARAQMLAGQDDQALAHLHAARALEQDSAATSYLIGLAHAHQGRFEQAIPFLEEAARLDAHTATLRFQLGHAYQMAQQHDQAMIQYRETVRLDPLHASAHFKLATYALRAGDRAEHERRQAEFQRLRRLFSEDTRTPQALERCLHTLPEPPSLAPATPAPSVPVRFADVSQEVFADEASRSASVAAVLDVDANGVSAVFVAAADGSAGLVKWSAGRFTREAAGVAPGRRGPWQQALVGDFFNDVPKGEKYDPERHAHNDVFLLGPNGCALLKRAGPALFEDLTASAGLAEVKGRRAQWVDYDHDGDLDLAVAAAGLELWQNNGNATFTNVTRQVGLGGLPPVLDVAAVDLDANVAMDLVVACGLLPSLVCLNQRAGQFARQPEPPGPWPAARRVVADDLDNDGNLDVLLIGAPEAVTVFGGSASRPVPGSNALAGPSDEPAARAGSPARRRFDLAALAEATGVLLDFDNDGWLDFGAAGAKASAPAEGALRLWRNGGDGQWSEATEATGLAAVQVAAVRDLLPADLDADGDTDLLLVSAAGRLHFLRNDGGNRHRQIKVRLLGTKTNPTGLGTRVEVRAGDFLAVRAVSRLPIELGLGHRQQLDSVQTVWSNGIVDNQLDVDATASPLVIPERNVAAGSCPYLYAWDGTRFRFVTDLLGNSPLGLSLRRGEVLPADPDEMVFVGSEVTFKPRRGFYELEVTEELREVLYLDEAHLIAVDHPADVEVHATDKLGPPPFPPSELWALRSPRPPLSAVGDDGIDRTAAVRALDGVFAPPGPPLPPPLRGQCHPLTVTLDFGPPAERSAGPPTHGVGAASKGSTSKENAGCAVPSPRADLVLALTGWLQYGDASVNIAASQNAALPVMPPMLEVETPNGLWERLDVVVGLPAGKTKTILVDLGRTLPPGARRLRLTTTFEVRWDRIALFERDVERAVRQFVLPPAKARLRWRGFSDIDSRGPDHPKTPDYNTVSARPPWRTTPQGWCTRYGDVLPLVRARDEQLVLLNAGDALRLGFDARALPPAPRGLRRSFFFHSVGWDKDADHNVVAGDTVEPLPVSSSGPWHDSYTTRWVPREGWWERRGNGTKAPSRPHAGQ